MPLESADFISQLNPLWPLGTDGVNTSDDHHRNTKKALQQSFPNIDKEVSANSDDLNLLAGAAADGSGLNPVGTILAGMWAAAPDGYLACDGAAINPIYTALIALVGANTPDLRGEFLRAWSTTGGQGDPDGPRAAGSTQSHEFEDHDHTTQGGGAPSSTGASGDNKLVLNNPGNTGQRGGSETRPRNVAVFYAIKW